MKSNSFIFTYFIKRFLVLVLFLQVSRLIFYFFNSSVFLDDTLKLIQTFLFSVGYDMASITLFMLPYFLLAFLFLFFGKISKWQVSILNVYFLILFLLIIVLSFVDIFYYKFNLRRINLEAVSLLRDSKSSIIHFATAHPSSILILILCLVFLIYFYKRTTLNSTSVVHSFSKIKLLLVGVLFFGSVSILLVRYVKYLSPLSASLIVEPGYTGLYTNSPMVFLYSYASSWTYVKPVQFVDEQKIDQVYPVFYANPDTTRPSNRNIMLFILESFSYPYLDVQNENKPSTPFFDSLIGHSTFYEKSYANNMTSANGLSSLLTGLPSLTNQPFFSSPYSTNPIDAIGITLSNHGYETHFALGANDDHYGFKKGTKLLGMSNYINGEALPASQHDGTWGIYDEPFLQYYASKAISFKQPFFSTLFTISSHDPFKIPDSLEGKFPVKNGFANENAISYVDYAFRHFFDAVKNEPWFINTIFIFTGDHVSKENKKEKFNFNSHFHVPIVVFDPQHPIGTRKKQVVQHLDLPATIAKMTGIKDSILCFGKPFEDTSNYRFNVNRYSENIIQMIDSSMLMQYDIIHHQCLAIYRIYSNDSIAIETDATRISQAKLEKTHVLKAFMQQYFNRLYRNRLTTKTTSSH